MANACWELYCLEHGIDPQGNFLIDDNDNDNDTNRHCSNTFFSISQHDKCVPRVLMVDFEPTVIGYRSLNFLVHFEVSNQSIYRRNTHGLVQISLWAGQFANW